MKIDRKKIEVAMARAKLTKPALAAKAGMPIPTICTVINRGSCKPVTIGRIAEALGVDVLDIIQDEQD